MLRPRGASGDCQALVNIIIPLTKSGIMIGSIFVITLVMVTTVVVSVMVRLAFRKRFAGSGLLFRLVIASHVIPSILISLGVGLMLSQSGLGVHWTTSGFGSQLAWTLPFGLPIIAPSLIAVALFGFTLSDDEFAPRRLGNWQTWRNLL